MEALKKIKLLDCMSNIEYELKVTPEIHARAITDMNFATKLLARRLNEGITIFDGSLESEHLSKSAPKHRFPTEAGTSSTEAVLRTTSSTAEKLSCTKRTVSDGSDRKTGVHNWTEDEVLLLIATYQEYQLEFMDENAGKADFWSKVSDNMKNTLIEWGLPPIDAKKCETKPDTLKRHYKSIKDGNKKSGYQKITWAFYDAMEELFGEQPWVKPLTVAGSNIADEMDVEIDRRPAKRQKTLTNYCEQLLAAKKESSGIHEQHHREKIAAANELTDVVKELVNCLKKKR